MKEGQRFLWVSYLLQAGDEWYRLSKILTSMVKLLVVLLGSGCTETERALISVTSGEEMADLEAWESSVDGWMSDFKESETPAKVSAAISANGPRGGRLRGRSVEEMTVSDAAGKVDDGEDAGEGVEGGDGEESR
ncbi:hypothetical protein CRG98_013325 [Punica granatum]|uniref:Uncharacterized protein n=1 Tax=Punica granatum TaxID=22663 RepID=A0A2I0KCN6_PUNGR|nr:hypothetical protein CRG98_013325 [Punica granatum]